MDVYGLNFASGPYHGDIPNLSGFQVPCSTSQVKKTFHSAHLGYEKNHHILQVIATPNYIDREMETWK